MRTASEAPRGWWSLVCSVPFGPYFWGKVGWTVGVWIHSVVAAILAFEVTGSAMFVGAVTAAQFLPQLLFTPLAGAFADHGDVTRQIVWGRVVSAVGSLGLAVATLAGTPPVAILLSSLCVGAGLVIGGPAIQSIVPSLVRPEELGDAVALNSVPLLVARAAAPALGAFIYAAAGPGVALFIAAAGSVVFAVAMAMLRLPPQGAAGDEDSSILAGWHFVRHHRVVVALLLGVAAVGFGADPSMTLTPSIADEFGGGPALVGWLGSTFGLGAAWGFVILRPLRRRFGDVGVAPMGLGAMAGSLVLLAASSAVPLAMVAFGVCGLGMTLALTCLTTLLHEATPDYLRGRVMAYWLMGFIGSRPLAGVVDGVVADVVSIDAALLTVAAITLAGAIVCWPGRLRTAG